jgi:hypothetical protein
LGTQTRSIKTLKGALTLAFDPSRAYATPDIEDGIIKLKATQVAIKYTKTLPGVMEIVQEQYLSPPPDMVAHNYHSHPWDTILPNIFASSASTPITVEPYPSPMTLTTY